jgi:undecaprenyl diphosphate synthase
MACVDYPPRHVAIVMDGNGRWAEQHGLPRPQGHIAGADNLDRVIGVFIQKGIAYLTLYVFSTENWERPKPEVDGIIGLIARIIDREVEFMQRSGIRMLSLGNLERLPSELQEKIRSAIELTRNNEVMTLCVAFDYGSRAEIIAAAQSMVQQGRQDIDEHSFSRHLVTAGIPDPDLIIRTGGEMRLSNFLLWQSAYSELYFTPVLWPDFGEEHIDQALDDYRQRQRRFGSV